MKTNDFSMERFIVERTAARSSLLGAMRDMTAKSLPTEIGVASLEMDVLLEPRLFAWHFGRAGEEVSVHQMLFRALPGEKSHRIPVNTDATGHVLLAGRGVLKTDLPSARLELTRGQNGEPLALFFQDREIHFQEVPSNFLPNTRIELVEHADPVLQAFFREHVEKGQPVTLTESPARFAPKILQALEFVGRHAPALHKALIESLRGIVLFEHPSSPSFAALQMHGMIFLNMCRPATIPFFVDGLVHQGGHVVFSEATLDRQAYFQVHPDAPLEQVTSKRDTRSVYEALHGLFTEYALLCAVDHNDAASLTAADALEMLGRSDFIRRRFEHDMLALEPHAEAVFTPAGMHLFRQFQELRAASRSRRPSTTFDLTGQPDEFDIGVFQRKNSAALATSHAYPNGGQNEP